MADAEYWVGEVMLRPGESLLAYTDGVTEARDENGGFFTESRLMSLLSGPPASAAGLLDVVERAVVDFEGGADPSDDLTLLAVHRKALTA
jgi:serine phosphatase RsbU (regulator of sigma subunit)